MCDGLEQRCDSALGRKSVSQDILYSGLYSFYLGCVCGWMSVVMNRLWVQPGAVANSAREGPSILCAALTHVEQPLTFLHF